MGNFKIEPATNDQISILIYAWNRLTRIQDNDVQLNYFFFTSR